jgi:hypothetical protein
MNKLQPLFGRVQKKEGKLNNIIPIKGNNPRTWREHA